MDYWQMGMGLLGGLAIFLYGMDVMTDALKIAAGDGLKRGLERLSSNRFSALMTGAGVTAIIQSSSVTTVLVVGFISAGVMSLQQSIGIIMGSNIGTTITAQVIAFKVTKYALGLVFLGWFPLFFVKREKLRHIFISIMGLGMVFLGMTLMSGATKPLRTFEPFIEAMAQMDTPLYGAALGALFTALVQSSSATTGVVIMLASQGILTLEAGIALVFGANIGTCVTAAIAGIGKDREVQQAVLVHVLFNVIGVLLWISFIPYLAEAVTLFSPSTDLSGVEKLAAETPRQVANAHTFFNVMNALILLPFTTPLSRFVTWLRPHKNTDLKPMGEPQYLNATVLGNPTFAFDLVRLEIMGLGSLLRVMMHKTFDWVLSEQPRGKMELEREIQDIEVAIDKVHAAIVSYLSKLSSQELSEDHSRKALSCLALVNACEGFSDTLCHQGTELVHTRVQSRVEIHPKTKEHFDHLWKMVAQRLESVLSSMSHENSEACDEILEQKKIVVHMAEMLSERLASRLLVSEPNRIPTYRLEIELSDMIQRLDHHVKDMAKQGRQLYKLQEA